MFTVHAFISRRCNPEFLVKKVWFCIVKPFFSKVLLNFLCLDFLSMLCTQRSNTQRIEGLTHGQFYACAISAVDAEPGCFGRKGHANLVLVN